MSVLVSVVSRICCWQILGYGVAGGALVGGCGPMVVDRLLMAWIAVRLGVCWDTANAVIFEAGQQLLIDQPARLDGV